MDIAVIGGGMFGVTAANNLANEGYSVTLFEKNSDILTGASGSNHWRLHRGYHYPQSDATAESALNTEPLFRSRYEEAVIEDENHYYAIAEDSWVSYDEYSEFMESHSLEYEAVDLDLVNNDNIEQTICVNENHVSPEKLRELCWAELDRSGVNTELNVEIASLAEVRDYDEVVIATYAHMNSILPEGHDLRRRYKFEICEVPIISLPANYQGNNIIVVYGPFMSTDHWGSTDYFAMGDYHNMRHFSSTGYLPEIPEKYHDFINNGVIEDPDISNFDQFRQLGKKYIPGVQNAEHIGSLFTIRTILPDVEDTDARPTMVNHSSGVTTIFGGKLATSVATSKKVVNIIHNRSQL
jgi:glycine/D-amino acid oxidase-like deaminating enzyme